MSIYRIKMNGKTYEMEIELIKEGNPKPVRTETVEPPKKIIPEPVSADDPVVYNPNTVIAPMPGTVLQILVNEGDSLNENDVVIILEAMKMENEICSPRAGKIKKIFVQPGQNVPADSPLFELED